MNSHITEHTKQDRLEESNAAATLMAHLSGKPIVETSGDASHQLNPTNISFKVNLSEKGDELAIAITQTDRHHPHLVHDTIKAALSELDELKNHTTKSLQPERDYNADSGKMVIRYDVPAGAADSIIHSLSKRAEMQGIASDNSNSWANKIEQTANHLPEQTQENWAKKAMRLLSGINSRA